MHSYQSTLKQLFQEFSEADADAQLASVTTRIMQALQNNLDGKSKQYRDPALTQLFLMNNIHYIVRSVRKFVFFFSLIVDLWWCCVNSYPLSMFSSLGQKQRICWGMIGCKYTVGSYSSMQTSIKEFLGQRFCFVTKTWSGISMICYLSQCNFSF